MKIKNKIFSINADDLSLKVELSNESWKEVFDLFDNLIDYEIKLYGLKIGRVTEWTSFPSCGNPNTFNSTIYIQLYDSFILKLIKKIFNKG